MSKHHVKRHRWINGTLNTYVREFETLALAKLFAENAEGNSIRIYNDDGECVHEVVVSPQETYA
jgi:hypothetical protein